MSLTSHAQVARAITKLPANIKKPGNYVLKRNLTFSAAEGNAINIIADDVVLDLGGRVLENSAGAGTSATGIHVDGRANVTIRNGTVRGFFRGISTENPQTATGNVVSDVVIDRCTAFGIYLKGTGHVARRCVVRSVGGTTSNVSDIFGILIEGSDAVVTDCEVASILAPSPRFARGISVGNGVHASVERNYVHTSQNAAGFIGINLTSFGATFVSDNRVAYFQFGISMNNGDAKYRNNLVIGSPTPFNGGTNAGGNL